jgi:hypothetical protein
MIVHGFPNDVIALQVKYAEYTSIASMVSIT